jgi:hypothetical protein
MHLYNARAVGAEHILFEEKVHIVGVSLGVFLEALVLG